MLSTNALPGALLPESVERTLSYDRHGFVIDGRRRFLLAGTVSYFRLAPSDWADRLKKLRDCGFNTVDVYVPWNYHETTEGTFDFATDSRNLPAFLEACHAQGLFVYFRPGPYICNEWDGGGLPAWLFTKPDVRLRQNDPAYLAYALRYLERVNAIARPFLHSKGGPILLYALENELDFFACEDPHGYIAALRDRALADGIDVPLTACIGQRTPVRAATGLVASVLPSPNIYANGPVEQKAAQALEALHSSQFADGSPMADVPPFVTEMNRDENSLKRILSVGFKGLGPFNFAGGMQHPGRWNAVNDWRGFTFLSSAIDFRGMIGFDGRIGETFYNARRVAGFINAFEEQIALTDSATSWESGAPSCDNPTLGEPEEADRPGRIYSLIGTDADTAFVFLWNPTDAPQTTTVQANGLRFPRYSALSVSPHYTHIATAGLSLTHAGVPARIHYSTTEVTSLTSTFDGAHLIVCGAPGSEGELCLQAENGELVLEDAPASVRTETTPDELTLIFRFGERSHTLVRVGQRLLTITALTREAAGREGLALSPEPSPAENLLRSPGWHEAPSASLQGSPARWTGAGRSMEELGALQGAGWYEFAFTAPEPGAATLTFPYAGDLVTVFVDGYYWESRIVDGGSLTIAGPFTAGPHRLRLRTEIWGHSNFDHNRAPSLRLGSLRGVWGAPLLDDNTPITGEWTFVQEAAVPFAESAPVVRSNGDSPLQESLSSGQVGTALPGVRRVFVLPLDQALPGGAVVTVTGEDCHGEIWAGDALAGRFVFGPLLGPHFAGGPPDQFYIPGERLAKGTSLSLVLHGVGSGGRLTALTLQRLP